MFLVIRVGQKYDLSNKKEGKVRVSISGEDERCGWKEGWKGGRKEKRKGEVRKRRNNRRIVVK